MLNPIYFYKPITNKNIKNNNFSIAINLVILTKTLNRVFCSFISKNIHVTNRQLVGLLNNPILKDSTFFLQLLSPLLGTPTYLLFKNLFFQEFLKITLNLKGPGLTCFIKHLGSYTIKRHRRVKKWLKRSYLKNF